MNRVIIKTKLFIPQNRENLISRKRLINKINSGLQGKITLISAPAGFGKTTLVTNWIEESKVKTAWFSIDENDNNLKKFMLYLISALQTINPEIGQAAIEALETGEAIDTETLVTLIINDTASINNNFILVLDDFHLLDNKEINDAILFLLNNLPTQLHIIMTTREDPLLPLAKFRVKNLLNEIRINDLRFTAREAGEFLNKIMGLHLNEKEIEALEQRTEGWIAGLQLAAISMQNISDYSTFINSFSGNHMFIVDYLMEEVLKLQDETTQNFLIFTSFLKQFSITLCKTIFAGSDIDSGEIIKNIDNKNLFIIPLDNEKTWFRYHHLFADLLKQRLNSDMKLKFGDLEFDITELHQKASDWYLDNQYKHEAYYHAQMSKSIDQIEKVCEMSWNYMDLNFQSDVWLNWLNVLPESIIHNNSILLTGLAWSKLDFGEIEGISSLLDEAEIIYEKEKKNKNKVVYDKKTFEKVPIKIGFARAYLASVSAEPDKTIEYAEATQKIIPNEDYFEKLMLNGMLGVAYWQKGELEKALLIFTNSIKIMYLNDDVTHAVSTKIVTSEILFELGRFGEALRQLDEAFENGKAYLKQLTPMLAKLYLTKTKIHLERYELNKSKESLKQSIELGNIAEIPDWKFRMLAVDSKLKLLEGNYEEALELLKKAKENYSICPIPLTYPLDTKYCEANIFANDIENADKWLIESNFSINNEITYLNEYNHLIMLKLYIKKLYDFYDKKTAHDLIKLSDRLYNSSHIGKRKYIELSSLIQKSLLLNLSDNKKEALETLGKAIHIAENSGYITVFLMEKDPLYSLVLEFAKKNKHNSFINKFLKTFENSIFLDNQEQSPNNSLVEPLSERELEILELISKGYSNNGISEKLFLSLNTVKWHNRNMFEKLQVKRRAEAIARAREIGLID